MHQGRALEVLGAQVTPQPQPPPREKPGWGWDTAPGLAWHHPPPQAPAPSAARAPRQGPTPAPSKQAITWASRRPYHRGPSPQPRGSPYLRSLPWEARACGGGDWTAAGSSLWQAPQHVYHSAHLPGWGRNKFHGRGQGRPERRPVCWAVFAQLQAASPPSTN